MKLATLSYQSMLRTKGRARQFWSTVRRFLIRVASDPPCTMRVHGKDLQMPLSHALPDYLSAFPFYDTLPARLSEFVYQNFGHLKCVNVGANVGDSIAALNRHAGDRFLAVEPNPRFFKDLRANWENVGTVKLLNIVCSGTGEAAAYQIHEHAGTASVTAVEHGKLLQTRTLDQIVAAHSEFSDVNLLLSDTDGNDFNVIAGAHEVIARNKPMVLFECEPSPHGRYAQDCIDTLNFFRSIGFESFLLYDNFGYLMGRYALADLSAFANLLFYQLTSPFYYFDILLMPEPYMNAFCATENSFFLDHSSKPAFRGLAAGAISTMAGLIAHKPVSGQAQA